MVLRAVRIRIQPFFRYTVLFTMVSRGGFYKGLMLTAAVLLVAGGAYAQDDAPAGVLAPADTTLVDPAAAQAQALQNEPALSISDPGSSPG